MKISINIDPSLSDTEITVNCSALTPETESIIAALRMMDSQITVITQTSHTEKWCKAPKIRQKQNKK